MSRPVFVFAGPSLFGAGIDTQAGSDIVWLPPARRGDIDKLLAQHGQPGVIGLADGTFHSYPSVGHAELRGALESGWLVYGLCSMGAIRACEMAHMGMRPYGKVAAGFIAQPETPDDEVALVHGADEPYAGITEPLVHIREFLRQMRAAGDLPAQDAAAIAAHFAGRWYGNRTLKALRERLLDLSADRRLSDALTQALGAFDRFRLKQRDLAAFVAERPWLA